MHASQVLAIVPKKDFIGSKKVHPSLHKDLFFAIYIYMEDVFMSLIDLVN